MTDAVAIALAKVHAAQYCRKVPGAAHALLDIEHGSMAPHAVWIVCQNDGDDDLKTIRDDKNLPALEKCRRQDDSGREGWDPNIPDTPGHRVEQANETCDPKTGDWSLTIINIPIR